MADGARPRLTPMALLYEYKRALEWLGVVVRTTPESRHDIATEDGEDGVWPLRAHVHHVADVSVMGALRLRLMLAGVTLEYWQYDQAAFQAANHYEREVGASLELAELIAESNVSILERLSDEEWSAPRRLPDGSEISVLDWLHHATLHINDHVAVLRRVVDV